MVAVEMGLNHSELVLLNGLGERINQLTNNLSPTGCRIHPGPALPLGRLMAGL